MQFFSLIRHILFGSCFMAIASANPANAQDSWRDLYRPQTFDGMPRPEGDASIVVSGLNTVFDQLIEAGLLQPDQLMPIRMGMGMGFVATGEDELTSDVEVRSNGGVYVNGQRMR